jgi:hypothetical protein
MDELERMRLRISGLEEELDFLKNGSKADMADLIHKVAFLEDVLHDIDVAGNSADVIRRCLDRWKEGTRPKPSAAGTGSEAPPS